MINKDLIANCEICSVGFKCDLDVSRHLFSENHIRNKEAFLSIQAQDKIVDNNIPKSLIEVLAALKLRSVKDVNDLADKGYFKIHDDELANIADCLTTVLIKSAIIFDSKGLPEKTRNDLVAAINQSRSKNSECSKNKAATQSKNTTDYMPSCSRQQLSSPQPSTSSGYTGRSSQYNVSKQISSPLQQPAVNLDSRVITEAGAQQGPAPRATARKAVTTIKLNNPASNQLDLRQPSFTRQTNPFDQSRRQTNPLQPTTSRQLNPLQPSTLTSRQQATQSVESRRPMARPNPPAPVPRQINLPRAASQTTTRPPNKGPNITHSRPTNSQAIPEPRVETTTTTTTTSASIDQAQPAQQNPIRRPPQPDPNSTYVPQLSIIKVKQEKLD